MLWSVKDTRSALMLRGCSTVCKFNFNSIIIIWRIAGSVVLASYWGQNSSSSAAWKLVCEFTKLCTMAIDKSVMSIPCTGTFTGVGSFPCPCYFSVASRTGFWLKKNQRIFRLGKAEILVGKSHMLSAQRAYHHGNSQNKLINHFDILCELW